MPKLSLRYRIAVTIFVLEAVMVGIVLWQTTSHMLRAAQEQQTVHEEVTLNPLANFSRIALLTDEVSEVQNYFQKLADSGDVMHILLVDNKNRIVASSSMAEIGQPLPKLQAGEDRYWRVRDIGNESGKMGVLAVEFSQAAVIEASRRTLNMGVALALAGMVIIAVVGVVMGRLLTRKLDRLAESAQRVAAGDLHAVSGFDGNDEVDKVGRAFDRMVRTIERQIEELRESRETFELAVSGTNDGIWDWNIAADVARFSARWKNMLGFSEDDPQLSNTIDDWQSRIHPDDKAAVLETLDAYFAGDEEFFLSEHRLQHKSGDYIWVQVRGKAQRSETDGVVRMAGSLTDITARKNQEDAIQHQALHDSLTGLPNRSLYMDRLQQAIRAAEREQKPFAVMMMDLNKFKWINDTLGHHVGDLVLQEVAVRIKSTLRASDTISRFGGDEFLILLPGDDANKVIHVVDKIRHAFETNLIIEGNSLNIEGSIGISIYPDHGTDAHTLIKRADVAMYAAKNSDIGYALYDSQNDLNSPNRLVLAGQLRKSIENDELVLHYQPKVSLRTGAVYGVEALVRWRHPHLGMLYPNDFIPLAEGSGLITPLTFWVLDAALRQHHQWRQAGVELVIAANLSARNLQDMDLPAKVAARLSAWHVSPQWLELEITESAIMGDPVRAQKILSQLDDMGVQLTIDDFGTGYSSLAYLKQLPVDEIKIDRSFVMDMLQDGSNRTIVQSTIDLGHNLGLKVVAEGVEDQECWNLLRSQGCDSAQGYYISRPMPGEEMLTWLAKWAARPRIMGVVGS